MQQSLKQKIQDFVTRFDAKKHYKIFLLAIGIVVLSFIVPKFINSGLKNYGAHKLELNIPAFGRLPALQVALENNSVLSDKVRLLLSIDELSLFTNYAQVNDLVTEIMFLWINIPSDKISTTNRQVLAENFIRFVYNLPADEPIQNNPFLEKYPWANVFQKIKAKLLMQGQGYKIFDGTAYYDSQKDLMIVKGTLSENFLDSLIQYISVLPLAEQKKYQNNYLMFIDETLGLKNLNADEQTLLVKLGFIKA